MWDVQVEKAFFFPVWDVILNIDNKIQKYERITPENASPANMKTATDISKLLMKVSEQASFRIWASSQKKLWLSRFVQKDSCNTIRLWSRASIMLNKRQSRTRNTAAGVHYDCEHQRFTNGHIMVIGHYCKEKISHTTENWDKAELRDALYVTDFVILCLNVHQHFGDNACA